MKPRIAVIFQPSRRMVDLCPIDIVDKLLNLETTDRIEIIRNPTDYSSLVDAMGNQNIPDGVFLFAHGDSEALQFISKKGYSKPEWWRCQNKVESFFAFGCHGGTILSQDVWNDIVDDWGGYTDEIWLLYDLNTRLPYRSFLLNMIESYSKNVSCMDLINTMEEQLFDSLISTSEIPGNEHFRGYIDALLNLLTCKQLQQSNYGT